MVRGRAGRSTRGGILCRVILSRAWSGFLIAVGVWNWLIWPRFAVAIWNDPRSFLDGSPTSFLWVHVLLIVASLAIGAALAVLGFKAWRAAGPASMSGPKEKL